MNEGQSIRFPTRKKNRLPHFDYSSCNYYFLTLCTKNQKCLFGRPNELNWAGAIVQEHVEKLQTYYHGVAVDKYTVMPNHVHLIIRHEGKIDPDIPQIIALLKTGVTKEIRRNHPKMEIWQRSFHDHIIRDQQSYEKIWLYIDANPQNWEKDCFFIPKTEKE